MLSKLIREAVLPIVQDFPHIDLEDKDLFVGAMTVCYHSMVASEPLLKLAAGRVSFHQSYFIEHEREERGHDAWMKKDIEALGGDVGEALPEIVTLCGEMYYRLKHQGSVALLAYMAVIEGFPASPEVVERFTKLYPEGSYTLAYHAKNDVGHYEALCAELDEIGEAMHEKLIAIAVRTAELYRDALWHMVLNVKGDIE